MDAILKAARRLLPIVLLLFLARPAPAVTVTRASTTTCSNAFTNHADCTLASGIAQGHGIVIAAFTNQDATTFFTGCSDSAGNTYTIDKAQYYAGNGLGVMVCSAYAASAIAPGGTTTVTEANASNGAGVLVYDVSLFASSSPTDTAVTAGANVISATPSVTGAGAVTATDVVFGIFWMKSGVWSADGTGYTGLDHGLTWNSYPAIAETEWKEVASGTPSASFTATASHETACIIVAYKESGGAAPCANFMALMGVGCR